MYISLYREGSRHSREKTLRSGVVYKHKTKDLLHEPTKAVSRSVFCFERVCFIIRCFAVYFVFLLTDGKRHAKQINSLIWPDFGGVPLILDEYILPAHANGNNLRVFPEIFGKLAEPFRAVAKWDKFPVPVFAYFPESVVIVKKDCFITIGKHLRQSFKTA